MEENVRQELKALEEMVLNWKQNYLEYASPEGNNDFLVEEFHEEISTYLSPYLRRLFQCNYLTQAQAEEFLDHCYSQVDELRRLIRELENPPVKPGVWQEMILKTKVVWQE
ncbi:MAG: hypothetical protein ACOZF2_04945 [Thermodesulfobacteriota bacterium]